MSDNLDQPLNPVNQEACDQTRDDLLAHMSAYSDKSSPQFKALLSVVGGKVVCAQCERPIAKHGKAAGGLESSSNRRTVVSPQPGGSQQQEYSAKEAAAVPIPSSTNTADDGSYIPPQQPMSAVTGQSYAPGPAAGQPVMGGIVPSQMLQMSTATGAPTAGGYHNQQAQQPGAVHQIAMAAASGAAPTSIIAATPESHLRATDGPSLHGACRCEPAPPMVGSASRGICNTIVCGFIVLLGYCATGWTFCWIYLSAVFGLAEETVIMIGIVGSTVGGFLYLALVIHQLRKGGRRLVQYKWLSIDNGRSLDWYLGILQEIQDSAPVIAYSASTVGHAAVGDFRYTNWNNVTTPPTIEQLRQMVGAARWVQFIPKVKIQFANGLTKHSYFQQQKDFKDINSRGTVIHINESLGLKSPARGQLTVLDQLASGWIPVRPGSKEEISSLLNGCCVNPNDFVVIPRDVLTVEIEFIKQIDTMAVVAHA